MLVARYRHRLPANDATGHIRARIAERVAAWNGVPGLVFKAFILDDRSRGAAANAYGSLYLWSDVGAATDFLAGAGFRSVVEAFVRPRVELLLPFDVDFEAAETARTISEETRLVGPEEDVGALRETDRVRSRAVAGQPGRLLTIVGLDTAEWRLTQFILWGQTARARPSAEIAYPASPGLATARSL